ncbi:AsmA-like C-terminal region-containing protein [Coraliomargarita sp. SDUM461004]|uniref:AsmA-like C-terminal region-containing protein n=1 Tax=Thalassobacterium sedimentorum TaxID=3041258 RepID=A0ABU1AGJ0_9BACT|nr:AsmA-like C-terminal region-containing protein [Coraliomargarita sp. SDUM461004]MDQ8193906.1 AsmA-like C-terminal region-containing protein [Coraliomargarita sp. SDUM461004]
MAFLKKLRLSLLLELFLDATLLLLFIGQALTVGCLLIYGYLPLPANWGNQIISTRLPPDLVIKVNEFRLNTRGSIELIGIEARSSGIKQNLFQADSAEVALQWQSLKQLPRPRCIVLSNGTLYIPSVYSPDGYRRPILERIAFRLVPEQNYWTVDRFAALHDNIRLRGTVELPARAAGPHTQSLQKQDIQEWIQSFYNQAAKLSQQKERIGYFLNPTIAFKFSSDHTQAHEIELRVSSPQLQHPEVRAQNVELRGTIQIQGDEIIPLTAPRLTATQLEVPKFEINTTGLSAEFPREELSGILNGQWPNLNLAAQRIQLKDFELDVPTLQIASHNYPELHFSGATRSLNGGIELDGHINVKTQSGQMRARGSVDPLTLVPTEISAKLPTLSYEIPPYLDILLDFDPGFALKQAELKAQILNLSIDKLSFNYIYTHASYQNGRYRIKDLYMRRQQQWLELQFNLDRTNHDYQVSLIGSAVPYEYNALLPHWWSAIFEDFDFSQTEESLGDFIIYGNTQRKAADLYYGHARARKVSYRGVLLDEAELIVRGRGPYCELSELDAHKGDGWARGNVAFTSRMGDGKGPVSIRLDMEAQLELQDAAKLFQGNVSNILTDFETEAMPRTRLTGVIFNQKHPEYTGKSYFDITAKLDAPLSFKRVPLDYLNLDLYGRSEITHLRNIQLGYAGGRGHASIDISTPKDASNTLRYQLTLEGAQQQLALQNLPQLDQLEDSLNATASTTVSKEDNAHVDIELHGTGPIVDPLGHTGFGQFEIRNEKLGTIQLLGPLSKILQNTHFNFTSFNLNRMRGDFHYQHEIVTFDHLRIDGARTQINAPGTLRLKDQALDMHVHVSLFGNFGDPNSNLRKISEFLTKPLPSLLEFELTGTLEKQKLRSLYDPRNLIPLFE